MEDSKSSRQENSFLRHGSISKIDCTFADKSVEEADRTFKYILGDQTNTMSNKSIAEKGE